MPKVALPSSHMPLRLQDPQPPVTPQSTEGSRGAVVSVAVAVPDAAPEVGVPEAAMPDEQHAESAPAGAPVVFVSQASASADPQPQSEPQPESDSADFLASYSAMVWEPMAPPTPSMARPSSTATATHSHIHPDASGWMATNAKAPAPAKARADTAHGGPATRWVMSQFSLDLRASGARMPT